LICYSNVDVVETETLCIYSAFLAHDHNQILQPSTERLFVGPVSSISLRKSNECFCNLTFDMTFKSLESKNSDSVFNSFYFSLCVFFYFRFVYFNLAIFALKCHKYCLSIWAVRGVVYWESVNGSRKTTKRKKNESQEELEICNRIAIKKCHFDTCQFVFK